MQTELETPAHGFSSFLCGGCGHVLSVPIRCGDRFCEVCAVQRKARIRDRFHDLTSHVSSIKSYTFKFMTLTIPAGPDLQVQYDLVVKSFRRLRQRKFWKSRVSGGGFVIEVTINDADQWHVHLHVIMYSAFLPVKKLSDEWSKCSPGKIVDIRMIRGPQVLGYITKYVAKSLALSRKKDEASVVLKGRRMFQPFGSFQSAVESTRKSLYFCPDCGESYWWYIPRNGGILQAIDNNTTSIPIIDLNTGLPPPQLKSVQLTMDNIMEYSRSDFRYSA